MIPPTPTFLPPQTPIFVVDQVYSLWQGAPQAVQAWNLSGALGTGIQLITLVGVIIVGGYTVYRSLQGLTEKDATE